VSSFQPDISNTNPIVRIVTDQLAFSFPTVLGEASIDVDGTLISTASIPNLLHKTKKSD
jgi:hypothetical protein